jgi:hypothetical protein
MCSQEVAGKDHRPAADGSPKSKGIGDEDLETLANSFMKHHPDTCKKFYVKAWSQRESARLSMKCISTYHLENDKETYTEMEMIRMKHEAKPIATYEMVCDFIKKHFADDKMLKLICEGLVNSEIPEETERGDEIVDFQTASVASASTKILRDITKRGNRQHVPRSCKVDTYQMEEEDEEWECEPDKKKVFRHVELVNFTKDDWQRSKKYDRSIILSILLVGHDAIVAKDIDSVGKSKWEELKRNCCEREQKLYNFDKIDKLPWSVVKDIINPMHEKYNKQKDLSKFHAMYKDAVLAWRNAGTKL